MGEKGSKWHVNLLYSRPLALNSRYMGHPSRLCTASQPVLNQLYLSRELMSPLSLVGTNTWGAAQRGTQRAAHHRKGTTQGRAGQTRQASAAHCACAVLQVQLHACKLLLRSATVFVTAVSMEPQLRQSPAAGACQASPPGRQTNCCQAVSSAEL
jgi:hypothetical protein